MASQVAGCGSWLHVREWELSKETRLRNANFCKRFLICPCCASRRAAKMVNAYADKVAVVMDMHPGLIPIMITLTIKNGPDLGERLQHIKDAWKRMGAARRKGASASGRHEAIEMNKVLGSVRAIEVTYNHKAKEWHPHIHIFALVTEFINPAHLSSEWEKFTGDSFIVDVRKVRPKSDDPEAMDPIKGGLIEVLKYVSKPSELPPELLYELYQTAKGSRFTDPHGLMRGIPEIVIEQDDDTGLDGPFRDFLALWNGDGYSLQAVSHRLDILKPGDPGYGAPRELIYIAPDDPDFYAGVAFPPEHLPPPRKYYADEPSTLAPP